MSWTSAITFGTCIFIMLMGTIWMCPADGWCNIILIDGGYTGNISKRTENSTSKTHVNCILTFDTNETDVQNTSSLKYGLVLLKNNGIYQITITRQQNQRPKLPIIFLNGTCNTILNDAQECYSDVINMKCQRGHDNSCKGNNVSFSFSNPDCNMTYLDPSCICKKAKYKECSDQSNNDIIMLNGTNPECYKCGTSIKQPEGHIQLKSQILVDTTSTNMAAVMVNLTSTVLEMMGNKSSVSVCVGEVQGVFMKPKDPTTLETVSLAYSNITNLSIIEDDTQVNTFSRSISIPKEAFQIALNKSSTGVFVAVLRFPDFMQDERNSTILDNEVYSVDMGAEIANLTDTVDLTFKDVDPNDGVPSCHSWNGEGSKPNWTTAGCNTTTKNGSVTCECQHLTFFALLMAPNPAANISNSDFINLTYITSIGCGLSLFFLCVALFMHFLLRRVATSDSVHILINLFVALSLLNLTFLTNEYVANSQNEIGCKLMAGFMHYCLLASFMWFGLEALHLCLQLAKNPATITHYLTKICIAGWVPPAIIVAIVFCVGKYGELVLYTDTGNVARMCWIADPVTQYVVNIGFYSVIFLFTLMTFSFMLRWLFLSRKLRVAHLKANTGVEQIRSRNTSTSDALTIMALCSMLGLTWGFAFLAYGALRLPAYYIFTVFNSFQGFFLFIYYYNSSRLVGETETQSGQCESTKESISIIENPYAKPKIF